MKLMDMTQLDKIRSGQGFFAALDQSGGSTPKALAEYGVAEGTYGSEEEMFDVVHAMRTRIVTSPAFDSSHLLAAILFQQTMERAMHGVPTAQYLWNVKHIVPFLKVDKGLADEEHGVQLMKPIEDLDELLTQAASHGIFGTKMRSVVKDAVSDGVRDIVAQQFQYGMQILAADLVPILEPEVSIESPHKEEAERLLRDELQLHIDALPKGATIMLKLTIPTEPGFYAELAADPRVLRVLALSGGYQRDTACELLVKNAAMIASFSRALLEGLSDEQTEKDFDGRLEASVSEIFDASVNKALG